MQFIAILSILLGEALVIFSEMRGAKHYSAGSDFYSAFLPSLLMVAVGATLLVVGYMLGLKYFQNVWIVTAFSLGTILLLEPVFNFFYMGHPPTLGAGIGFALGAAGILAALFVK